MMGGEQPAVETMETGRAKAGALVGDDGHWRSPDQGAAAGPPEARWLAAMSPIALAIRRYFVPVTVRSRNQLTRSPQGSLSFDSPDRKATTVPTCVCP